MPIFAFYDFRIGQRKDDEVDMFRVQEEDSHPPAHATRELSPSR